MICIKRANTIYYLHRIEMKTIDVMAITTTAAATTTVALIIAISSTAIIKIVKAKTYIII